MLHCLSQQTGIFPEGLSASLKVSNNVLKVDVWLSVQRACTALCMDSPCAGEVAGMQSRQRLADKAVLQSTGPGLKLPSPS